MFNYSFFLQLTLFFIFIVLDYSHIHNPHVVIFQWHETDFDCAGKELLTHYSS